MSFHVFIGHMESFFLKYCFKPFAHFFSFGRTDFLIDLWELLTYSVYESFIFYVSCKHLSLCSLPFHFLNGNFRGTELLNMNTVKFYQGFPLYLLSFAS